MKEKISSGVEDEVKYREQEKEETSLLEAHRAILWR